MCAKDGGSTSFGSAAATKRTPSAIWTRTVSQGEASRFLQRHDSGPVALFPLAPDPVGPAVAIDEEVVEARAEELLREHVRVLAVAAGAVDDDRDRAVAAFADERRHAGVDVALPDGKAARAGDVALLVVLRAARVQEERAARDEPRGVVARDLDEGLVVRREAAKQVGWGGEEFSASDPAAAGVAVRGGLLARARVLFFEAHSPSKKLRTLPVLQSQQEREGRWTGEGSRRIPGLLLSDLQRIRVIADERELALARRERVRDEGAEDRAPERASRPRGDAGGGSRRHSKQASGRRRSADVAGA